MVLLRVPRTERVEVNRSSQVSNAEKDQSRSTSDARRQSVARTCNLIFIVLDVLKPLNDLKILTNELEGFGIRLNKKPPNIVVKKREKGGVSQACSSIANRRLKRACVDPNHQHCATHESRPGRNPGCHV
jgi:hypothetical protein